MSEATRLARLRSLFVGSGAPAGVVVGIGDDAAVLAGGGELVVWTVDAAVEGVHFRREWMSLEEIGRRSLMAAASDLAAMGALPCGALSALVLPSTFRDDELDALARGQAEAARELGTAVLGGNLSRGGELSITTSVLGQVERPIRRDGARGGDVVAISGGVGLAAAGLEALRRGARDPRLAEAVRAFISPSARVGAGRAARAAHAGLDISDGLALDAARLAEASDVAIVIEAERLLAACGPALGAAAEALGLAPLELALHGGEDYELLMTFDPGEVPSGFTSIGRCAPGRGAWLASGGDEPRPLDARGHDHFPAT